MRAMLEWVCPRCGRDVDPGFTTCPFCHAAEDAPAPPPAPPAAGSVPGRAVRGASRTASDLERGLRFGLGLVVAVACAYLLLLLVAYVQQRYDWIDRLAGWLRLR